MTLVKKIFGTSFGFGYAPFAPGTVGSMAAMIPIYILIAFQPWFILLVFSLIWSLLTLWVSPALSGIWGKDPSKVVSDEWAGLAIVFIGFESSGLLADDLIWLAVGFILFRFFDIVKPLGIKKLQDLPGGWGILADDILAGLYGLMCLKTLIFAWPKISGMA